MCERASSLDIKYRNRRKRKDQTTSHFLPNIPILRVCNMQLFVLFALGSFTLAVIWKPIIHRFILRLLQRETQSSPREEKLGAIKALAEHHEVAETLNELIQKDGAGSWPPNTKHTHTTWPLPLRAYKEIYLELAPLLPQAEPSLDDQVNIARIALSPTIPHVAP